MRPRVALTPVQGEVLDELIEAAVNGADPDEACPPVPGDPRPGWTQARRETLRAYHLARVPGLAGPHAERTWAILLERRVVGAGRLHRCRESGLEVGLWLTRSSRGRGVGSAALALLLDEARTAGTPCVFALVAEDNEASLVLLRRAGATLGRTAKGVAEARIDL